MISRDHQNRRAHNWLVYQQGDRMIQEMEFIYKGVLCDLGCGEAPMREYFSQHVERYIGVDWAESIHSVQADVIADLNKPLPIGTETLDTIVSISVLEHLREPKKVIEEAYRVLKPGGVLVIQVPWQWRVHEEPHDYFRYTPYGLRSMLEGASYRDIEIKPQAGFFSMLVLKLNYFSLRFIQGPKPVRYLIYAIFSIFWYLGQKAAPVLDKLDRNWEAEAPGYFVVAHKAPE